MGRGAGNTETEYLVLEVNKFSKKNYNLIKINKIISKYFDGLKSKYKWGQILLLSR